MVLVPVLCPISVLSSYLFSTPVYAFLVRYMWAHQTGSHRRKAKIDFFFYFCLVLCFPSAVPAEGSTGGRRGWGKAWSPSPYVHSPQTFCGAPSVLNAHLVTPRPQLHRPSLGRHYSEIMIAAASAYREKLWQTIVVGQYRVVR